MIDRAEPRPNQIPELQALISKGEAARKKLIAELVKHYGTEESADLPGDRQDKDLFIELLSSPTVFLNYNPEHPTFLYIANVAHREVSLPNFQIEQFLPGDDSADFKRYCAYLQMRIGLLGDDQDTVRTMVKQIIDDYPY